MEDCIKLPKNNCFIYYTNLILNKGKDEISPKPALISQPDDDNNKRKINSNGFLEMKNIIVK